MSRPLTDRERALVAEARVAELEAELAEFRRASASDAAHRLDVVQERRAVRLIQQLRGSHHSRGCGRTLIALMDRPGSVVPHDQLFEAAKIGDFTLTNSVKVYICNLRRALEAAGMPDAIQTVWGEGYLLRGEVAGRIADLIARADGEAA